MVKTADEILTELNANAFKPPAAREVMADHPVVQMGDAAAKSVEATADTVVEEAQALKQACSDFADDLRKGAQTIADRASHVLKKIHKAGKELQAARENYLNGVMEDTSHAPPRPPLDRQQPGATTTQPISDGS